MRRHALAALGALLLAGCLSSSDDDRDRDRDRDRPKAEERARSHCVAAAQSRGLRVEKAGQAQKVGKKQYEVKLRIDAYKQLDKKKNKKKGDDIRLLCRYDDESRRATLYD